MNPTIGLIAGLLGIVLTTASITALLFGGGKIRERVVKLEGKMEYIEELINAKLQNLADSIKAQGENFKEDIHRIEEKLDGWGRDHHRRRNDISGGE